MRTVACFLALVVTLAIGCGPKRVPTAEETFSSAKDYFDSGAYELAIQSYRELLDQYPFSEHAAEAEAKIAQAYYLMGRYPEAIAAFGDFERMHPTSPLVPLVNYYLGMSYLRQMRPLDRDQGSSGNAHAYFRAVIDRYPGTPWAQRARLRLRECEEALAAHELYVARFYFRHGNLSAAEARIAKLLKAYAHTDIAGEALYLLGEEYLKRDLQELSELALLALVAHYPDTPPARRASARLAGLTHSATPMAATAAGDPLALLLLRLAERRLGMSEP